MNKCTGNSNRKLQLDVSVYYVRCAQSPRAVCHSFTIARRPLFPDFRTLYLTSWWYAQLHAWIETAFWCKVKDIFAKVQS